MAPECSSRTTTLPTSPRATRRGSRLKDARSRGRIWRMCPEVCDDFRMQANLNRTGPLNRFGLRISCGRDVRRRVFERFTWFVGTLLVFRTHFSNHVVPAVFPTDGSLSIHNSPGSVRSSESLSCLPVGVEGDEERIAIALAHFPLADIVASSGHHFAQRRTAELDAGDLGRRKFLLVAVLVNDHRRSLEVHARNLSRRKALAVAVFENYYDGIAIIRRPGSGPRHSVG